MGQDTNFENEVQARRWAQLRETNRRRQIGRGSGGRVPPFHVSGVDLIYYICRFDPARIAEVVPEGLEPADSGWGTICAYTVSYGWELAPYTAFFLSAEVKGLDSPDGSPGQYIHCGVISGVGGEVLRSQYNTNFKEGYAQHHLHGERIEAEAGVGDDVFVRMRGNLKGANFEPYTARTPYIGRHPEGGFCRYMVAFNGKIAVIPDNEVEYLKGADQLFNIMEPIEYTWPMYTREASLTFGRPRRLGRDYSEIADDYVGVALVELLARTGRAAAVVKKDGTLLRLNAAADALAELGFVQVVEGRLKPSSPRLASSLEGLIARVASGAESVSRPLGLTSELSHSILMVQGLALDPRAMGSNLALLFFDEPRSDVGHDPGPALRLLGLTESESGIAKLVGSGASPKQTAEQLGLSVNTVRSALKTVYHKLDIGRQAELASLVTRLETQAVG